MSIDTAPSEYVIRRADTCNGCKLCVRECANEAHTAHPKQKTVHAQSERCVNCLRCVAICPMNAIEIRKNVNTYVANANWTEKTIRNIRKQSATGGILLSGAGNDSLYPIYWDHMLINASQVTNPSIDPLREPMELCTHLGRKPDRIESDPNLAPPLLSPSIPILISAMSYGSVNLNVCRALASACETIGTYYNAGEGGVHEDIRAYAKHTIVQVASGRFGVDVDYLQNAAAIEMKMGQGAKPGIGGHLPGYKVDEQISKTRMIPSGTDALSPAPHHDIYSIEDLKQLIYCLKEVTHDKKPIFVKVAAVHNIAAICSGIAAAGADVIVIDGFRGGTGAAPLMIRNTVGIPIEFALAAVDTRLRQEGIRHQVSLICSGSIRNSADIIKAVMLGADAVYIGTAALIALGCHMCQKCHTGRCNWGIATQNASLALRLDPDQGAQNVVRLLRAWSHEIKEMMGGMGINSIESMRGNRLMLRGIDLYAHELDVLGIKPIGT